MKTLIIGGSGFIGTNLIGQLTASHDILNFDKNKSTKYSSVTTIVDIRDMDNLNTHFTSDISSVVLLAAEHRDDVAPLSLYYDVNVQGTQNVIDVCKKRKINKIIFTSSVAVYGLNMNNPSESTPVNPFNHYGESKWQAEQLLMKWQAESLERSLVIIRPTVVFGPGNKGNVYNLLSQIISGKFMMVGRGKNKKSLAYVDNVAGFIEFSLETNEPGAKVYNYIDTPDLSINELLHFVEKFLNKKISSVRIPYLFGFSAAKCIDMIAKLTKKKYAVSGVRVKKFCATTQFSSKKMLESGYLPKVSLHQGLHSTLQSITEELDSKTGSVKVMSSNVYKVKEAN